MTAVSSEEYEDYKNGKESPGYRTVSSDPTQIGVGGNPDHKMVMAWADDKHEFTYVHRSFGMTHADHTFMLGDKETGNIVSRLMLKDSGEVQGVETHPDYRRQGLATKLYDFAKRTHEKIPTIPAPKHSESRTNLGQQWAKSTGDELPPLRSRVSARDYRGARWE